MMKNDGFIAISIFFLLLLAIGACQEDNVFFEGPVSLEFSADTLRFDTVFTELGSSTRTLKIYNPEQEAILIDEIRLLEGSGSSFRLNIDGISSNMAENVKIRGGDSLYIFAEVTIDPDQPLSVSPFIVEEWLIFDINGSEQQVLLEAFGQNANYIPSRFFDGQQALLSCDFGEVVWDDPKPYVIYGALFVDSCTLVLPEGTQVYIHGGIARQDSIFYNDGLLFFFENGNLISQGTLDNPVTIQGDRLEESFQDVAGQWGGIRFLSGSRSNELRHTTIKNSLIGLRADSAAQVDLYNTQIYNTSASGIIASHAEMYGENCLVYNNGGYSLLLNFGGIYEFNYSTFANYGNNTPAVRLDNFFCSDILCSEGAFVYPLIADFTNSFLFGSSRDEIELQDATQGEEPDFFQYSMKNCIVAVDELLDEENYPDFFNHCDPCLNTTFRDTLFVNPSNGDFHLDTLSVAEEMAIPLPNILYDLEGNPRDMEAPDIGCFEYQY